MASFHFIRLRLCAMRVEVFSLHRLLTCTSILVEDDDVVVVAFEALFGTTMSHGDLAPLLEAEGCSIPPRLLPSTLDEGERGICLSFGTLGSVRPLQKIFFKKEKNSN